MNKQIEKECELPVLTLEEFNKQVSNELNENYSKLTGNLIDALENYKRIDYLKTKLQNVNHQACLNNLENANKQNKKIKEKLKKAE